jgi:hypothetical protein
MNFFLAHVHLHHDNQVETKIFAVISHVAPSGLCLAMVAGEAGLLSAKLLNTAQLPFLTSTLPPS